MKINFQQYFLVVIFLAANTKGPNLLGRDILRLLQFSWERLLNVYYVEENVGTENCLNKLLPEYTEAFKFKMVDDDVASSGADLVILVPK